jgi:hypothetical protein
MEERAGMIAPRCPWQSPYVERLIGSIRRECLDHVIVINRAHLHELIQSSVASSASVYSEESVLSSASRSEP